MDGQNLEEYKLFFGKKFKYYQNQDQNKILNWNWASFFLGGFWLIHRKLYSIAILHTLVILAENSISSYVDIYGLRTLKVSLLSLAFSLLLAIILGIFGNRLVINRFRKYKLKEDKTYSKKRFRLKSLIIIVVYIIIYAGISVSIEELIKTNYKKNIFTIDNVDMLLSPPLISEISDNSIIFFFKDSDQDTGETGSLIFQKHKNNETIITNKIDDIKLMNAPCYTVYDDTQSNYIYLILHDFYADFIYKLNYEGEVLSRREFPVFLQDSIQVNPGIIKFVVKDDENSFVEYSYDIYSDYISTAELNDFNKSLEKIKLSDKYFTLENNKLDIYDINREMIDSIKDITDEIMPFVDLYEFESYYIVAQQDLITKKQNITIYNKSNSNKKSFQLDDFDLEFIIKNNQDYISLWGTIENYKDINKIQEIRIDNDLNLTRHTLNKFHFTKRFTSLSHIIDSNNELIIGGINGYSSLFILRVNDNNELLKF